LDSESSLARKSTGLPPENLSGYVAEHALKTERMGFLVMCQADSRILTFLCG
jgi:hypothetical protein